MTKNKYRPVDTRVLNAMTDIREEVAAYHENNARNEAQRLAEKYKASPVYLKLVSMHLAAVADKAFSAHQQEQPRKRNPDSGQFVSEDYYDND